MQDDFSVDCYTILDIPLSAVGSPLNPKVVKDAYRRALLQHHPDKIEHSRLSSTGEEYGKDLHSANKGLQTVDDITKAYAILSNNRTKQQYDAHFTRKPHEPQLSKIASFVTTELEDVDLDDMQYRENSRTWTKRCRCGREHSFEVSEDDLVQVSSAQNGEILAYCPDCSHHIRILFSVTEG